MTGSTERQEMVEKVRQLPAAVEAAVEGLDDRQLDTAPGAGEWSIRQVVHHLADSHMNLFIRMKLTLTEERPTLRPYDQERWAELPDTTSLPISASLQLLKGLHQRAVGLLEAVPEDGWQRSAFHPEVGEVNLTQLLATLAGHGENHLRQMAKIRAANGW